MQRLSNCFITQNRTQWEKQEDTWDKARQAPILTAQTQDENRMTVDMVIKNEWDCTNLPAFITGSERQNLPILQSLYRMGMRDITFKIRCDMWFGSRLEERRA